MKSQFLNTNKNYNTHLNEITQKTKIKLIIIEI